MSRRVEFIWPEALVEAVDAARGDVSRSKFVQRALEKALGSSDSSQPAKLSEAESVRAQVDWLTERQRKLNASREKKT